MEFIHNKIFKNASWIIVCKIGQALLSLIVTMISARYLGPSGYGIINYVAAIVSFVTPLTQLGLCNIQVQEYVNYPEDEGKILGSSIILSLISSIGCIVGCIAFVSIANQNEKETILICAIYSILLLFQGAELFQYWFQYKYQSKYYSIISVLAYIVVSCYKIILLVQKRALVWFAFSNSLDFLLILILSYLAYRRLGGHPLKFSKEISKRMFEKSKYYIFSSMMIVIFTQTGKILLNIMLDTETTGIYSAAVTIANLANFVFLAIIDSFRPQIFEAFKQSHELFEKKMKSLYAVIFYLSFAFCAVVTVMSPLLVDAIYGKTYHGAINLLRVMIWYNVFSFVGNSRNVWILAEGKQKWLWLINMSGAITNIGVNILLIPRIGAMGASIASVLAQLVANVIVSLIIPDIRPSIILLIKSLNVRNLLPQKHKTT